MVRGEGSVDGKEKEIGCMNQPITAKNVREAGFQIWKTITIGGKSKDELLCELETCGFMVQDGARDMMAKESFVITPEPAEFDLVKTTVGDLGFPEGATTSELWNRIRDRGGRLCPPDLGPHLRLAYSNQYRIEFIRLAMEQITDSVVCPRVFVIRYGGRGLVLDSSRVTPDFVWVPGFLLVFVQPCK